MCVDLKDDDSSSSDDDFEESENTFLNSWSDFGGVLVVPAKESNADDDVKKPESSKSKKKSKKKKSKKDKKTTTKKKKKKKSKKSSSKDKKESAASSSTDIPKGSWNPNGSFHSPSDDDWSKVAAEKTKKRSSVKKGSSSSNSKKQKNAKSEGEVEAMLRKSERSLSLEDVMIFEDDDDSEADKNQQSSSTMDSSIRSQSMNHSASTMNSSIRSQSIADDGSWTRGSFHAPTDDGWSKGISSNVKGKRASVTNNMKQATPAEIARRVNSMDDDDEQEIVKSAKSTTKEQKKKPKIEEKHQPEVVGNGKPNKNNLIEPKTWGEFLHGSFKSPSSGQDWSKIAPDSTRLSQSWPAPAKDNNKKNGASTTKTATNSKKDEDDVERLRRLNAERSEEVARRKSEREQAASKRKSERASRNHGSFQFAEETTTKINKSNRSNSTNQVQQTKRTDVRTSQTSNTKQSNATTTWGNSSFTKPSSGGNWSKVKPENSKMHESWPSQFSRNSFDQDSDSDDEVERTRRINAQRTQEVARGKSEREAEESRRKSERAGHRNSLEIAQMDRAAKEATSTTMKNREHQEEQQKRSSNYQYNQNRASKRTFESWNHGSFTSPNSGNWSKVAPEYQHDDEELQSKAIRGSVKGLEQHKESSRKSVERAATKESQAITQKAERALSRATEGTRWSKVKPENQSGESSSSPLPRRDSQEILQKAEEARMRAMESRMSTNSSRWDSDNASVSSERQQDASNEVQRKNQANSERQIANDAKQRYQVSIQPSPTKSTTTAEQKANYGKSQRAAKPWRASVPIANPTRKLSFDSYMGLYRPMAGRRFSDGNFGIYSPARGGWLLIHPV